MKLKILLILIMPLGIFKGYAQNSQHWDLKSCIDYALKNNIQVKQSELNRNQNKINLKSAKYSRLPTLNASTGYTLSSGRNIDPFTNTIVENNVQSQRIGLNTSVTLFNYSSITNQIKKGGIDLQISEYDLEDSKNITTLNVITFFTNVLLNEEQVNNAKFSLETTKLRLDVVEKQFDAGVVAQQDVLQIKQQLAVDEVNLVQAENAFQFAKLTLQQAMQLPVSNDFTVINPQLGDPNTDQVLISKESVYNQALSSQPNIKSADASVESAALDVKINQANYYPTVTLNGSLGTSFSSVAPDQIPRDGSPNTIIERLVGVVQSSGDSVIASSLEPVEFVDLTYGRQLDFNQNSSLTLSLNIPIFNGFRARNGVQSARIGQRRAELNAQNVKNQLRQNIEQAYQDAIAAAKSYESSKRQIQALEDSFKNVEKRRDLGSATAIEYNQIKNDLSVAQSNLTRNKYDYIFKLKILDFYQGKPLSF